uniref:J domain-containing protein n=1 Tax=Populus trichocarpa TaxID=3694 RepID=A0A2K2BCU1_POPTR|eukprot:XP_024451061.1 auxilin-like protein 1 isoform X2 [Populus trichocarpa]
MEHQQVSSVSAAAPFSKKFSYDRGHGGKHVYDGVFSGGGGAVKLGARVLDYREIFGGTAATASSIPILDVPELNENSKVSSFGAQRADYATIFGGFGDDDFGLLHEELFAKRKKVKSSINGTRSLAEARSRNAGSKHSNVSKEQKDSSPEAPFQSIDGVKLLNVSYNKSNPGNKNGTNGMTRVAQLNAVPGYTFLVDEITPSKMTEGGKPARSVLNDSHLNANVGKSVKEDTARRKAVSGPQPRIADTNSFRSPAEFQKKSSRNRSISNDMPFDAFEIGLGRRPPSSSPTNSSYNIGGTDISKNSKFGVSRNDASRGADLLASSDEEMDANSDAAASAAALRKAIEEAQMKIKIAKELMERKNEGFQNHAKTGFNKSWKAQKSEVKTEERLKRSNELVDREMREKEDTAKQEFTGVSEGNVSKASQLTPDFGDEKKSSFANNAAGETHSKESKSTRTDNRLEAEDWESTEEFFEAADYEELREMPSEFEQSDNAEKMASYNHENKWSEKMTAEEKIKKPEECTEEVFNEDKVERELNSVVGAFRWNLYANFVKPSQVCHPEENENKTRISNNHEETYQTPTVSDEWNDCETVLENLHQPEENVKLPVQELDENEDMKELKDAQDWVETEKKQREALDQKETDNRSDEVSIREENDRDLDQIYEKKQNVEGQQEERDRVECEMKQGGWNLEEYAEKLNDLHRGEISGDDGETEESEKPEKLVDDEEILKKSDQMNEPEESTKLPVHELAENEDMKELKDWVETEKQRRKALDQKETENRSDEVPVREENDRGLNQIYEKEENVEGQLEEWDRVECEMKRGWNLEEYEEKLNDLHRGEISGEDGETEKNEKLDKLVDDEEILKKSDQMNGTEENAELPVQELEENEDMKGLKDAQDWVETEKKQREALDHREMENRSDEVPIGEESDGGLDQIYEKKENMEGQRKEWDRVECEMKQGGWNLEENEKLNDLHRREILGEEGKIEESEKPEELMDDEEILKKSDQINETENREEKAREGIETERIRSKSCLGEQDEKTMEVTEQALRYEGDNLEMAEDANEQYENENLGGSDNALGCKINFAVGDLKAEVLTVKENGRVMRVTESSPLLQGTEKESEAVEDANNLEQQNCEIAGLTQGLIGLDRIKKQTADVTEALLNGENGIYLGENDINFDDKQNEHHVTEYKNMSNQEKCFEEVNNEMDDNGNVDICEPEVGTDNEESEKSSISSHNERWSSDETESLHDPECCVEEAAHELGENNNDVKESEVATNHEKDKNSFESSEEDRWVGNGVDTEASQQPIFEGQGKTTEISLEEEPNQSTSKKEENHCKNPAIEEKEAEDNLQRKLEVEKKHFSKKEEVKVREIEREKERIAVERAIQEARERAFAEARERAAVKRAAAEAHQRLKAEVRERLGKALLEANNKLAAEKASFEAKLKAERAAVERATTEARQRALEKALSEKVAFKARNQAEKSAAERFSSISKDNGMNSRDKQCNDPGPSSSSRYPGSSNHGERFNGGNGESDPRNKATLERHQRTAERAAKALAEKNMRELLAQKEQAERNRLAETLEADVKRWSSGKERNLRALLSTLPYILGPDSGWQPIPLTELVSSTAVKKAYRKATLFVHPDKLQQRGASIQLKYTCEKVFDLLKDAWNKFSAEER